MKTIRATIAFAVLAAACLVVTPTAGAQQKSGSYSLLGLTFGKDEIVEVGLDGKIKHELATGKDPHEVVVSADGRVFVSNTTQPSVSIIDLKDFKELSQLKSPYFGSSEATSLPHGLDLSRDGNILYITTERAAKPGVVVYDLKANSARTYIETGQNGGHLVKVHPKKDRVYVVNSRSGTISVIDTQANVLKGNIPVMGTPYSMEFSADGSLWVAANDGTVSIVDTDKDVVQLQLTGKGKGSGRIRFSPDGRIVIATRADGVDVFDAKNRKWLTYFPVENDQSVTGVKHAIYAAFAPTGDVLYLSGINASSIFVIDLKTYKEVARWKLPVRVTTLDIIYPNGKKGSEN